MPHKSKTPLVRRSSERREGYVEVRVKYYPRFVKLFIVSVQGYRIWIFRGRLAGETPFLTVNFGQLRPPASEYQGDSTGNVRRKSQEIPIWILKIFICDSPASRYSQRVLVLDQFEGQTDQGYGVAEHGHGLAVSLGPAVQTVQLVP